MRFLEQRSSDRPVKRQGAKPGGRGTVLGRLERMSQTVQTSVYLYFSIYPSSPDYSLLFVDKCVLRNLPRTQEASLLFIAGLCVLFIQILYGFT